MTSYEKLQFLSSYNSSYFSVGELLSLWKFHTFDGKIPSEFELNLNKDDNLLINKLYEKVERLAFFKTGGAS